MFLITIKVHFHIFCFVCYFVFVCRHAADRGHPHASHNLAVGHLQGYRTDVKDKK